MISCIALALLFSGCSSKKEEKEKISVYASILPQRYFIEKVAGDKVTVDIMVKPGQSPETYEPSPEQIVSLGNADVFFTIGVPFEKQFIKSIESSIKTLRLVDTSEGVSKRMLEGHDHGHEEGEDEHGHEEGSEDPHIWLSPAQVKIQARNIYDALCEIDPAGRDYYTANLEIFLKELDDIHAELEEVLGPYKGSTVFVFHPAFGYFTDEFNLRQEAIETGGKEPAPATLMKIVSEAIEDGVKIVFVQPEFPKESAESVADAIGGTVVELNPLDPDYINNLKHIAEEIKKSNNLK